MSTAYFRVAVGTGPAWKPINGKTEAIISPEPGPAFAHKHKTGVEKNWKKRLKLETIILEN
jgi:hypothetical protein